VAFNAFDFIVFFPLVVFMFYVLPHRFRWILILMASSVFYMVFSWQCLVVIYGIITVNYCLGIGIHKKNGQTRKILFRAGIILNILILVFFKYFNYLNIDLQKVSRFFNLNYPDRFILIIFPIGLSFLTFSAISYLADVNKKAIRCERHLGIFVSYFLFFPKMMQGPIERAGNVLPQFYKKHDFTYENATEGMKLMAWGFFKKLVIADWLAPFVSYGYASAEGQSGLILLLSSIFFAIQIYADFSGYIDIATGSARILGFNLTPNFRRPYLSDSIKEFWNRWHISLSSWLRDYLFLPIAYSLSRKLKKDSYLKMRADKWIYVISTFITFIVCGIWHGVGWTYVFWGGLFAFYLSFALLTKKFRKMATKKLGLNRNPHILKGIKILSTFVLVDFAWIFFRADSLSNALTVIRRLLHGWSFSLINSSLSAINQYGLNKKQLLAGVAFAGVMFLVDVLTEKKYIFQRIREQPLLVRWGIYYFITYVILFFGASGSKPFIYSRF
jgi:D-alanyl-lipoteichoic acid acyltransferase DltB (MBOAT superfamily)